MPATSRRLAAPAAALLIAVMTAAPGWSSGDHSGGPRQPAGKERLTPDRTADGGYLSEALPLIGAPAWHQNGYTGSGLRVGIIATGFNGATDLVGKELPSAELVHSSQFGTPARPEPATGTPVAEVVHDVAPGTELYLAAVAITEVDVSAAVSWFHDEGVDIVLSLPHVYFSGPGDGTGWFQDLIEASAADHGTLWIVPAGDARFKHWQGKSRDLDGNGLVDTTGEDDRLLLESCRSHSQSLRPGEFLEVYLVWNDWDDSMVQTFPLTLTRTDSVTGETSVESSVLRRVARDVPYLRLGTPLSERGIYGLEISTSSRSFGDTADLELFVTTPGLCITEGSSEGSLLQPADTERALAVADSSLAGSVQDSSVGPTNGPGGQLDGGRLKPDITGYSGVSTASSAGRPVSGTDIAAAHVAGAAALVWQGYPELDAATVRELLEDRAVDADDTPDVFTGHGTVFIGDPPPSLPCPSALSTRSVVMGPEGGHGEVAVEGDPYCEWSALSHAPWITVDDSPQRGSAVVGYVVAPNPGAAERAGAITIGGPRLTVVQDGRGCVYSLSTGSAEVDAGPGQGELTITTDDGCGWTAISDVPWLRITDGASGLGPGTVTYRVEANPWPEPRSGRITIGGLTYTVTQGSGAPDSDCIDDTDTLCLLGDRFAVEVSWSSQYDGRSGRGRTIPHSDNTGFFWFFDRSNVELIVKILDGTRVNGSFWLFFGGLSDVEYTITVTDTVTGAVRDYRNEPGQLCGQADTTAFRGSEALASSAASSTTMAGSATPTTNAFTSCGTAFYDDGTSGGAVWFGGGHAGDPDSLLAVRIALDDFGFAPGATVLTGFCAGNSIDYGGPWPNEVFVHPDLDGRPDPSVVLGHGTIVTGNGTGAAEVALDPPVTVTDDVWLVLRGDPQWEGYDINLEHDGGPGTGHSWVSASGYAGLQPMTVDGAPDGADLVLRADLAPLGQSDLEAAFDWSPEAPRVGDRIRFTDLSAGTVRAWSWSFGDGSSSTEREPDHVYATSGEFTVRLTVSGPGGSDDAFATVHVREASTSDCFEDWSTTCLLGGRFRVRVRWHDQRRQRDGQATAEPMTDSTSRFWFFDSDNIELVVKVLDASGVNRHFWVLYGALSDVEYWVEVQDMATGANRIYHNPPGRICGRADSGAFPSD